MTDIRTKIEDLINNDYEFNFGDYISKGFNLLNKNVGGFIGFMILSSMITGMIRVIPIIGIIGQMAITYPIAAGFYLVAHRFYKNKEYDFGNFFDGFKMFQPLLVLMLIVTGITIVAALPMFGVVGYSLIDFYMYGMDDPDMILEFVESINWGLFFVASIPLIIVSILYAWAPFFVIFHDLPAWEAMEASRKLIMKKWFVFFGFFIVVGLIAMSGIILLIAGIVYTLPFIYTASYVAFDDIVGTENIENEDDLFDHLVG